MPAAASDTRWLDEIERIAGLEIQRGYSLAGRTSLRIGGPAEALCVAQRVDAVVALVEVVTRYAVPLTILGGGTNVLVSDAGLEGVVLELGAGFQDIDETVVSSRVLWHAGAACPTGKLVRRAVDLGLAGLEVLAGVPGTLGGALVMNAGGHTGAIGSIVRRVQVLERGAVRWIGVEEVGFGYRSSHFPAGAVLLGAELELAPAADVEALRQEVRTAQERRRKTQPLTVPNAGSIFKNPPGAYAGALIEEAGCKGWREGGALVSPVHANFIVNQANASAEDVWRLIQRVRGAVRRHSALELELEIRLLGDFRKEEGNP